MSSPLSASRVPARPGGRRPVRLITTGLASLALALGSVGLAALPAQAASKSLATKAEYSLISEGQTLRRVRDIIDSRGKVVEEGTYVWKSTQGKVVVVSFDDSRVSVKQRLVVASLSEYRKVDQGDSYSRVKRIIGGPASISNREGDVWYRAWLSPDLRNIIELTFNDEGRVVAKHRMPADEYLGPYRAS